MTPPDLLRRVVHVHPRSSAVANGYGGTSGSRLQFF